MTARVTRLTRQDLKASARTCTACGSKLSSYNENDTCWSHTVDLPWKGPNTKPR